MHMNMCFVREQDCAIRENKQQQIKKMNGQNGEKVPVFKSAGNF